MATATAAAPAVAAMAAAGEDALASLRAAAAAILARGGAPTAAAKEEYAGLMARWAAAGGPADDAVVAVGSAVYGVEAAAAAKPAAEAKAAAPAVAYARVDFDFLEGFMKDVFVQYGVPDEEAVTAAKVLIESDKRGIDSHGIGRLNPIYCQRLKAGIMKPTAPFEVVKETPSTAVIDGHMGLGLVIGPRAMDMCIAKAKEVGVAMVVVRNSTHYGMAGYYPLMAVAKGCIGFTGTNARPSIAPLGGVQPMLGTNPITFGCGSDDPFPYVLDCATSINQRGKIERYAREGMPTPAGQVIDKQGVVRTDTDGILKDLTTRNCALAPLGGVSMDTGAHKGTGYATVCEILSTALQGNPTSPELTGVDQATGKPAPMPLGHWFIAVDVARFTEVSTFESRVGGLLRELRASEKNPKGDGEIMTAGEPEHRAWTERSQNGGTLVPPALQKDMVNLRAQFPALQDKYAKFS